MARQSKTFSQIAELVLELEEEIEARLREFEKTEGVYVDNIYLDRIDVQSKD